MKIRDLFRLKSDLSIQDVLFKEILIIALAISILNIVANLLIDFPFEANYKWFFMIGLTFVIAKYHERSEWISFGFVFVIITTLLPMGWYISGARNNNVIAYVFLIIVSVSFLFNQAKRVFLVGLTILIFTIFVVIEFYYPYVLPQYDDQLVFQDRVIQMSLALTGTYIMLRQFANAYHKNNQLLRDQSKVLEEMAYTDQLTGIHNRAYIFERFDECLKSQRSFTTVMMDIDDFKHINDSYGHMVGDEILESMGCLLSAHFSDIGYVARYGGDEFILLLTADVDLVSFKLELFKESFLNLSKVEEVGATISAGFSAYDGTHLNDHLKAVDAALYQAKELGKNRIICA